MKQDTQEISLPKSGMQHFQGRDLPVSHPTRAGTVGKANGTQSTAGRGPNLMALQRSPPAAGNQEKVRSPCSVEIVVPLTQTRTSASAARLPGPNCLQERGESQAVQSTGF